MRRLSRRAFERGDSSRIREEDRAEIEINGFLRSAFSVSEIEEILTRGAFEFAAFLSRQGTKGIHRYGQRLVCRDSENEKERGGAVAREIR